MYVRKLGFDISPSLMTSRPISACRLTHWSMAFLISASSSFSPYGWPATLALISLSRSGGRDRLPTCVVRIGWSRFSFASSRQETVDLAFVARVGDQRIVAPSANALTAERRVSRRSSAILAHHEQELRPWTVSRHSRERRLGRAQRDLTSPACRGCCRAPDITPCSASAPPGATAAGAGAPASCL